MLPIGPESARCCHAAAMGQTHGNVSCESVKRGAHVAMTADIMLIECWWTLIEGVVRIEIEIDVVAAARQQTMMQIDTNQHK